MKFELYKRKLNWKKKTNLIFLNMTMKLELWTTLMSTVNQTQQGNTYYLHQFLSPVESWRSLATQTRCPAHLSSCQRTDRRSSTVTRYQTWTVPPQLLMRMLSRQQWETGCLVRRRRAGRWLKWVVYVPRTEMLKHSRKLRDLKLIN